MRLGAVAGIAWMLAGGCGPAGSSTDRNPLGRTLVEPASPPPPIAEAQGDVGAESLRAWLLDTRPNAAVEVERAPGPGDAAWYHVRARDGDVSFEAWLQTPDDRASRWWRVAEIAAAVLRNDVVALESDDYWRLWATQGTARLCSPREGTCAALPQLGLVASFYCRDAGLCWLATHGDAGRVERWDL